MSEVTDVTVEEITETTPVLCEKELAEKLTKRFVLWSMGGSLIPIAFVDLAAIIGVQIKLVAELSKIYKVPFEKNRIKGIVAPLIGSLGIAPAGTMVFYSLVKLIPGIGTVVGALSFPIVIGAITYATGKIFTAHFESGGTLLSFNVNEAKDSFKKHYEEGQSVAQEMKATEPESTPAPKSSSKK